MRTLFKSEINSIKMNAEVLNKDFSVCRVIIRSEKLIISFIDFINLWNIYYINNNVHGTNSDNLRRTSRELLPDDQSGVKFRDKR